MGSRLPLCVPQLVILLDKRSREMRGPTLYLSLKKGIVFLDGLLLVNNSRLWGPVDLWLRHYSFKSLAL